MSTFGYHGEPTDYSKNGGMTTRTGVPRTTNDCIEQVLDLSSGKPGGSNVAVATGQKWNCEQDSALDLSRSSEQVVDGQAFALDLTKPACRYTEAHVTCIDQSAGMSHIGNQSQQPFHQHGGRMPAHLDGPRNTNLLQAALRPSQSGTVFQSSTQTVSSPASGPNMRDVSAKTITAAMTRAALINSNRGPIHTFPRMFPKPVGISVPQGAVAHTSSSGGSAIITGLQKPIAVTPPQPQASVVPTPSTTSVTQSGSQQQTADQSSSVNRTRPQEAAVMQVGTAAMSATAIEAVQGHLKRFFGSQNFIQHADHLPTGHSCEICSKSFKTKAALKLHMTIHKAVEEREFGCDICGRRFLHQHHLIVHQRKHSGEKPFKCEVCGRSFMAVFLLHKHLRTHVRENASGKGASTFQLQGHEASRLNKLSVSETTTSDNSVSQSVNDDSFTHVTGVPLRSNALLNQGSSSLDGNFNKTTTKTTQSASGNIEIEKSGVWKKVGSSKSGFEAVQESSNDFYLNEEDGVFVKREVHLNSRPATIVEDRELDDRSKMEAVAECLLNLKANIIASEQRKLTMENQAQINIPGSITGSTVSDIQDVQGIKRKVSELEPDTPKTAKTLNSNLGKVPAASTSREVEHQCKQCGKTLSTEQQLYIHMSSHNREKIPKRRGRRQATGIRVQCDVCSRSFLSQHHLFIHMGVHRSKVIRAGGRKRKLQTKIAQTAGVSCTICKKKFKFQRSLNSHMAIHTKMAVSHCTTAHSETVKNRGTEVTDRIEFPVKEIVKKTDNLVVKEMHTITSQTDDQSGCSKPVLESSESQLTDVDAVEKSSQLRPDAVPGDKEDEEISDDDSVVELWNRANVQVREPDSPEVYVIGKTKFRRFACHACDKKFSTKQKLRLHQMVHKDNCFLCDICGKSYFREVTLQKHIKTHSMARPHACNVCKKTFIHRSSLKRHKSTHCELSDKTTAPLTSSMDVKMQAYLQTIQAKPELRVQTVSDVCNEVMDLSLPRKVEDLSQPPVLSPVMAPVVSVADISPCDTRASLSPPLITSEVSPRNINLDVPKITRSHSAPLESSPLISTEGATGTQQMDNDVPRPHSSDHRAGTPSSSIVDAVLERRKRRDSRDISGGKHEGPGFQFKPRKTRVYQTSCRVCKEVFPNVMGLKAHMPIHNRIETHLYECRVCHHRFTQSCSLLRHLKTSCQQNTLKCLKCGKVFQRKRSFLKHQESHEQEDGQFNLSGSFLDVRKDEVAMEVCDGDVDTNYSPENVAAKSDYEGRQNLIFYRQLSSTNLDENDDGREETTDSYGRSSADDLSDASEYEQTTPPLSARSPVSLNTDIGAGTSTLNLLSEICTDIINATREEENKLKKEIESRQKELDTVAILANNLSIGLSSLQSIMPQPAVLHPKADLEVIEIEDEEDENLRNIPTVVLEIASRPAQKRDVFDPQMTATMPSTSVVPTGSKTETSPCSTLADICSHMLAKELKCVSAENKDQPPLRPESSSVKLPDISQQTSAGFKQEEEESTKQKISERPLEQPQGSTSPLHPPPLVNVFHCDLCGMLLYDKDDLHIHLQEHGRLDGRAAIQELVREVKEGKGQGIEETKAAGSSAHNSEDPGQSTKNDVLNLSLSSDKNSDTEGMDGSYSLCSSDVSSEALSLPTTPTVSKPPPSLLELRKELRNKIHARRRSQGLDEITVEFKQPEPSELTSEERYKLDYRRECNRQAAQRSRLRKKDLVDGLLQELHKEEVVNLSLRQQIDSLEKWKQTLVNVLDTHERTCPNLIQVNRTQKERS